MSIPARLAAFAAAVALVFGAGAAIGAAVGPIDEPAPSGPARTDVRTPGTDHAPPPTTGGHQHGTGGGPS